MTPLEILSEIFPSAEFKSIIPTCPRKNAVCESYHTVELVENLSNAKLLDVALECIDLKSTTHAFICKKIKKKILEKIQSIKIESSMQDEFLPSRRIPLSQISDHASKFTEDDFKVAQSIQKSIDRQIHALEELKKIDYDANNVTSTIPFSSYGAFAIKSPLRHEIPKDVAYDYLLSVCPKNIHQVGDLFHLAMDQKVNLLISMFCKGERDCMSTYWEDCVLKEVPMRYGWTVDVDPQRTMVLAENPTKNVTLYERKIKLIHHATSNVVFLTHLHYNGWPDAKFVQTRKY